eukprot:CAMPEP_0194516678 /NCGR_PEP_ID=MMETSP0253-20130528/49626_1 /TAXON_ID=2966 /ORGANISM="Noctiluca scintillans" /LENGTH=140 /DNA_ID=CAMNT_0039360559 /DNA_START=186 /DNA_END=605 /DNA_ORIENTATION=-
MYIERGVTLEEPIELGLSCENGLAVRGISSADVDGKLLTAGARGEETELAAAATAHAETIGQPPLCESGVVNWELVGLGLGLARVRTSEEEHSACLWSDRDTENWLVWLSPERPVKGGAVLVRTKFGGGGIAGGKKGENS